jgi:hypothetical protein
MPAKAAIQFFIPSGTATPKLHARLRGYNEFVVAVGAQSHLIDP